MSAKREGIEKMGALEKVTFVEISYPDLPFVCKICAFSPEKPTKRQKFYYTSGRSRYNFGHPFVKFQACISPHLVLETEFIIDSRKKNPLLKWAVLSTGGLLKKKFHHLLVRMT